MFRPYVAPMALRLSQPSGKLSKFTGPLNYCCLPRREVIACYRLFHRSGLLDQHTQWKRFWINSSAMIPRVSVAGFHTTTQWNSDTQKPKDDDKNNREQFVALMKSVITFSVLSMILGALFGPRQRPQIDPETAKILQQNDRGMQFPGQGQTPPPPQTQSSDVTWHDFYYNMLLAGEVESVTVFPSMNVAAVTMRPGAIFKGQRVDGYTFRLLLKKDSSEFENTIRSAESKLGIPPEEGVTIIYQRQPETLSKIVNALIVIGVFALLFKMAGKFRSTMMSSNPFSKLGKAEFTLIDPQIKTGKGVKFSDVAGMKEAKVEVREFVDYLKNPSRYKELGAKPPKGALLTGPPGCGKTMLAKAVANESDVPFLSMNGSEFIEMIGGLGAARVRNLFLEARNRSPSIIYIDEIDAIGRKRSGSANSGGVGEAEQTLNQLLVEMDGIASKEGVIMLASTNRADVLDKALLRPGRFDRHILIDLPTVIERKEILDHHMKSVQLSTEAARYSERLSTLTPGFSGADLANVVNEAALHAARIKNDKVKPENFEYAIERVIAGPEKRTNVLSPHEKKIVAYHESGHALVGWMMEHTDALLKVTILPRTSQALGFAQYTPLDKKLHSPEELLDRMCMALGGRVAESLTFNKVTTGAQNDLEKVTKMAYSQIKYFGFNEKVGLLSFENDEGGVKPYSKRLHATMDQEARSLITVAYKRTEELLIRHKELLKILAEALLAKETLNYDDVLKLLGPPPHGKKNLVTPVDFENSLNHQSKL